jgi:non-specific serine/threonine protein kinase
MSGSVGRHDDAGTEPIRVRQPSGAALAPGESLAGYVIEELIGRGGMGLVYRALDPELGRQVALKIIAPTVADDPAFRRRFEREWRLAATLEHPHVVPVYRAGEESGQLFLAMRLIQGESLEARLQAGGPLDPREAVHVVEQIAQALDAAHARGLVHRDVKPANVLLEGDGGWAYLVDFGLTVTLDAQTAITRDGMFMGTAAYAAPEQISGGEVGPRTDVYALGGVLHHCLTGEPPFPAENLLDALSAHLSRPPPQPSRCRDVVPRGFDEVVGRAMAKEPARRFPSAGRLAEAAGNALGPVVAAASAGDRRGGASPSPVPVPLTPLIGRERELAELRSLLAGDHPRLITLTGPGGSGKTRLATELASGAEADFVGGAAFVQLAAVRDPSRVTVAVAQALGARETPGRSLDATLVEQLSDQALLLLLDNFEHVIEAAPLVADLLQAAPALRVVATSREPLRVVGEQEYGVPPLGVPEVGRRVDLDELARSDAVSLFVARAAAVRRDFRLTAENARAVAEICARLDGLPLAIELAAARVRVLPPPALLERLEHSLDLLTGGAREQPERQRTLRGTLDWSHELLTGTEQAVFRRLAVFENGWTLAQAEAICDPDGDLGSDVLDGLGSLVEKSLIREEPAAGEPRFRMLQTVREYAREKLQEDPLCDAVGRSHAQHFAAEAEAAGWFSDEVALLDRLNPIADDLRAALAWSRSAGDEQLLVRISAQTANLYIARGLLNEAEVLLDQTFAETPDLDPEIMSLNLANRAYLHHLRSEPERAMALLGQARALATRSAAPARWLAEIANTTGVVAKDAGDFRTAIEAFADSVRLWDDIGDEPEAATVRVNLANAHVLAGDPRACIDVIAEARTQRLSSIDQSYVLLIEARATLALGEPGEARKPLRDALSGLSALEAEYANVQMERTWLWPWILGQCLDELARAVSVQGRVDLAARLWGASETLREEIGTPRTPALGVIHVEAIAQAAAKTDGDVFAAAWAQGRAMDGAAALAYALAEAEE